jgi:hypothetical protein
MSALDRKADIGDGNLNDRGHSNASAGQIFSWLNSEDERRLLRFGIIFVYLAARCFFSCAA